MQAAAGMDELDRERALPGRGDGFARESLLVVEGERLTPGRNFPPLESLDRVPPPSNDTRCSPSRSAPDGNVRDGALVATASLFPPGDAIRSV